MLHQENKTNKGRLSWAMPHLDIIFTWVHVYSFISAYFSFPLFIFFMILTIFSFLLFLLFVMSHVANFLINIPYFLIPIAYFLIPITYYLVYITQFSKLSPPQSNFNSVVWAELALIPKFTPPHPQGKYWEGNFNTVIGKTSNVGLWGHPSLMTNVPVVN